MQPGEAGVDVNLRATALHQHLHSGRWRGEAALPGKVMEWQDDGRTGAAAATASMHVAVLRAERKTSRV